MIAAVRSKCGEGRESRTRLIPPKSERVLERSLTAHSPMILRIVGPGTRIGEGRVPAEAPPSPSAGGPPRPSSTFRLETLRRLG